MHIGKGIQGFFFGNYFYGICAVALCAETLVQHHLPTQLPALYLFVFAATVWYYTLAYTVVATPLFQNPRSKWYAGQAQWVRVSQYSLFLLMVATGIYLWVYRLHLTTLSVGYTIGLVLSFLLAVLYYGGSHAQLFSLRRIGWIKPFVIGFTWAGMVSILPLALAATPHYPPTTMSWVLLVKNGMFISLLCILFDIKDYPADANASLKTFVVQHGLRFTLYRVLLPLALGGLLWFWWVAYHQQFSVQRVVANTIPFVALLWVAHQMHQKRSIVFYLNVIDGLMLLKALCGIVGSI
jgi:hypothetical protein